MPLSSVQGTPYYIPNGEGENALRSVISDLAERVALLRTEGKLTEKTLHEYYGETRFAQIAESNALEGSTLSVGETELAVLKGITISGHDPAYSQDAQSLARAVDELAQMAKSSTPTNLQQLQKLHGLILGGRPSAGSFRHEEVRIRGSQHVPPRTWAEVMHAMQQWESWSTSNPATPTLLRAVVLHAWLEHIHPFLDGNGRTGRAITNLELVRAGYPPIVIRRKDRDPYLDALVRADNGDIGAFLDIVAGRTEDALRDLERAAQRKQGYDLMRQRARKAQENRLAFWNAGVNLLFAGIRSRLTEALGDSGAEINMHQYDQLSVDDFIDLCEGQPIRLSWAFTIRCRVAGMPVIEYLAWAGVMGDVLRSRLSQEPGRPAVMWSVRNPNGYPPWVRTETDAPGGEQLTIHRDRWLCAAAGHVVEKSPSELAGTIAEHIARKTIPDDTL